MKLHLGVHNIAYAAQFHTKAGKVKRGISKAQAAYGKGKTTADIAKILEARYHIMDKFLEMHRSDVLAAIDKSVIGSINNIVSGQSGPIEPMAQAMSDLETVFKQNLSNRVYDGEISGVPTRAAQRGVSHRFKQPYARRPARPSFIDTGLYQSSFTMWTEP